MTRALDGCPLGIERPCEFVKRVERKEIPSEYIGKVNHLADRVAVLDSRIQRAVDDLKAAMAEARV